MSRIQAMQQLARQLSSGLQLTPPFLPTEFVAQLAATRRLSIHLVAFPMLGTVTGYCLRLDDATYIVFYDPDAAPERRAHIIYHEVAHIVLEHIPLSDPSQIDQMLAWRAGELPKDFVPMFQRQRYGLRFELDAEALALALTALSLRTPSLAYVLDESDDRGVRSRIAEFYRTMGM